MNIGWQTSTVKGSTFAILYLAHINERIEWSSCTKEMVYKSAVVDLEMGLLQESMSVNGGEGVKEMCR